MNGSFGLATRDLGPAILNNFNHHIRIATYVLGTINFEPRFLEIGGKCHFYSTHSQMSSDVPKRCGCVLFVCDIGGTHNDVY